MPNSVTFIKKEFSQDVAAARRASIRQWRIIDAEQKRLVEEKHIAEMLARLARKDGNLCPGDQVSRSLAEAILVADQVRMNKLTAQIRAGWGNVPGTEIPGNWATLPPPTEEFVFAARMRSKALIPDGPVDEDGIALFDPEDPYRSEVEEPVPVLRVRREPKYKPRSIREKPVPARQQQFHDPLCRDEATGVRPHPACAGGMACRPDQI